MTIFALRETVPSPAAPALRTRAQRHPLAMAVAVLVAGLVLLPIAATLVLALSGTGADWPHLARYVLPQAATTTLVLDRKSTRLNSSHVKISYAVFCLKQKT